MNNYYFKKDKTIEVLRKLKNGLIKERKNLEKAFELDFKEWEYKVEFEKILNIFDEIELQEYLPKFTKEKIVDGIGKIALISNLNPYLIVYFILASIYTNNKVCIILENKMLASNKSLIECMKKTINELKLDSDTIEYEQMRNKDMIVSKQDNYDLIYYLGNKEEYLNFIKRIHIDTLFENFGEIYIYSDLDNIEDILRNINIFAYINEIDIKYFDIKQEESILKVNKLNNIKKISTIFTENIENAYKFVNSIKSEKIYINKDPTKDFKFSINMKNLVYTKKIEW